MKKRKSPVLLVTSLVLLLGAVAFMNAPQSTGQPQQEQHSADDGHGHDDGPKAPSKTDLASKVQASVQAAPPSGKKMPVRGMPGTEPSILKPKQTPYKPTYNESATSTQWYTDETPKDVPTPAKSTSDAPAKAAPVAKS